MENYAYMFYLLLGFNIGAVVAYFVVTRILYPESEIEFTTGKVDHNFLPENLTANSLNRFKEEARIAGAAIQHSHTGTQADPRVPHRI